MENPKGEPQRILLRDLGTDYYRLQFLVDEGSDHLKKEMEVSMKAGEIVGRLYDALVKQYDRTTRCRRAISTFSACASCSASMPRMPACSGGATCSTTTWPTTRRRTCQGTATPLRGAQHAPGEAQPGTTSRCWQPSLHQRRTLCRGDRHPPVHRRDARHAAPRCLHGLRLERNLADHLRRHLRVHAEPRDAPRRRHALHEHREHPQGHRPAVPRRPQARVPRTSAEPVQKASNGSLHAFQDKLASLTFLDPACGSGNFLTETYVCLRRLENEVIRPSTQRGQPSGDFDNPIKVSINQFYGIEINDFAVTVATTALWISEARCWPRPSASSIATSTSCR